MKSYQDFVRDYKPSSQDEELYEMSFGYFLSIYLDKFVDKKLSLKALSVSVVLDSFDDLYNIATLAKGFTQEQYEEALKRFNTILETDYEIYSIEATLWFDDGSYSLYKEDYSSSSYYWQHYPIVPDLPSQTIL